MLRFENLAGEALAAALEDLARLRVAVFRDWPYLYDGDAEYERGYLAGYAADDAVLVAALDGTTLVGAATAMPLARHSDALAPAFAAWGLDPDAIFYCAESVLLPGFRGQGAGHVFFDRREAHARALGFQNSAFCAVDRPVDHPARPAGYRPLDDFWKSRKYARIQGFSVPMSWRDVGKLQADEKRLSVWTKAL